MAADEPLCVGGHEIPRGKRARLELPIARLTTGTWASLPVEVVNGRRPGPRVWVNAAIHGDEVNGVSIIRRVLRRLRPARMAGAVIAVPIVNVFGFLALSRYLPDRRDLNRSFPGSARGSMASQLAHLFMTEVVAPCELGIDLHTGSNQRENLPQIRGDLDDEETLACARTFGAPVMLHASIRKGSLRQAGVDAGKHVLVYESGEALRHDERAVTLGERGVLRVLARLGIWNEAPPPPEEAPVECRRSRWVRARRSGMLEMCVDPGTTVAEHDVVGRIHNTFGSEHAKVRAPADGIVIAVSRAAQANRGEAVVHIAELSG